MTKISAVTYGCSLNHSDTEAMLSHLKKAGHEIIEEPDNADLVLINSCTVKNLAEKKLFKAIKEFEAKGKKVIIAGCVAQAHQEYLSSRLQEYSVIGTRQINNVAEIVDSTLKGRTIHAIDMDCEKRICIPIIRKNPYVGIVPIAEGCLGNCTYCKTRFARGTIKSYEPEAIIQRIKTDIASGCKEIWLTAQDCGAYGAEIGTNLPELLNKVLEIYGDFKVRLGMANPNHIHKFLPEMIRIYKKHATEKGKLFAFIHLPVQSGSDEILKKMRRQYNTKQFKEIIIALRKEVPHITISTDIIVGFPGETEEQFKETLKLVEESDFDVINVSRFWARPGTEAAMMPNQIHGQVSKIRSEELNKIKNKKSKGRNQRWKEWEGTIIIDEKGTTGGWVGRNYAYKPVAVKGNYKLGQEAKVKIKGIHTHYLEGTEKEET